MSKITITVTEASRNFSGCLSRSQLQRVIIVLLKRGKPVARLVPVDEKVGLGRDLAKALARTKMSVAEAKAWHRDLTRARARLSRLKVSKPKQPGTR